MKDPFLEWKDEIKQYCELNSLDFEKVQKSVSAWGKNFLAFLYFDRQKGRKGLLDETPATVLLTVEKTDNGLIFQQTKNTKKYLGIGG